MNAVKEKGIANIDYVVAIIVFILGSIAALGLYYSVYLSMAKIKVNETIIGYVTEICEIIDLESYESVNNQTKINTIINNCNIPEQYSVVCTSVEKFNNAIEGDEHDIIEKVNLRVNYELAGTQREYLISKVKVKE